MDSLVASDAGEALGLAQSLGQRAAASGRVPVGGSRSHRSGGHAANVTRVGIDVVDGPPVGATSGKG
jgi:hypothetical protein